MKENLEHVKGFRVHQHFVAMNILSLPMAGYGQPAAIVFPSGGAFTFCPLFPSVGTLLKLGSLRDISLGVDMCGRQMSFSMSLSQ